MYTNFHKDCSVEETCFILKLDNIVNELEHFMNMEVTLCNYYVTYTIPRCIIGEMEMCNNI